MTNQYSVLIGLEKTLFRTIVAVSPLLIGLLPQAWMNVTLGAVLTFAVNYAKNRNIQEVQNTTSQG